MLENDDEGGSIETDKKMTEKTVNDVFSLTDYGFSYVAYELEKINKKAKRIGVKPLELKVVKEYTIRREDEMTKQATVVKMHDVKIEGTPPIIDGYEFIASIEHSDAGNIINISPAASVKELPAEYRTSNTDCDYCHTKRDRLNTFVLRKTDTGEFKKVGRSCLKNFLPSKNPQSILEYASMLGKMLGALVGGEEMEEREGGGTRWSKYYDADSFFVDVCAAYILNGNRFTSGKAAKENPELQSTAGFALDLMNMRWNTGFAKKYGPKLEAVLPKATELAEKVNTWKETKDWDAEMEKKPDMATYFHNLKVLSNSPAIQYKNAGYHASLLAVYLREMEWKERQAADQAKAKTKSYIGKVGDKIAFTGVLKKYKAWETQWGMTHMYLFLETGTENEIIYFSSRDLNLDEGKTYKVKGTVKAQSPSKYTGAPQTIITRGKAELAP